MCDQIATCPKCGTTHDFSKPGRTCEDCLVAMRFNCSREAIKWLYQPRIGFCIINYVCPKCGKINIERPEFELLCERCGFEFRHIYTSDSNTHPFSDWNYGISTIGR